MSQYPIGQILQTPFDVPYGGRSNYRSQLPIKRSPPRRRQDLQRIGDLFGRLGGNQQRPIYNFGPDRPPEPTMRPALPPELRNQVGDFFNSRNLSSRSPPPFATPAVEPDFTVFDPYGDGGPFDRRFPQPPPMPSASEETVGFSPPFDRRFPQPPSRFPQPPRNRFPQPQPPIGFPRPPGRFPQPSPMPFPSPGRKGQRNRPQPGGYYPQPPSSPNYPGERFPSPGRKGNRSSYQQPRTPFGYGQIQDMSYRFGGAGVPQNIYGFQDPHYSPYQPPSYSPNPYDPGGQP